MEVSVGQAADALGVSERRVRQLILAGRLRARKVGREWLVDGASLPAGPRRGRPMSVAVAWAFVADIPPAEGAQAMWRRRSRRARLSQDPVPELLLASWVASRGRRDLFVGREPARVLDDARVVRSGVSDPRSGLSAADLAEGWVREVDLPAVRHEHLLRPASGGYSVVLHVAPAGVRLPVEPVPLLLLAADLTDHEGPREVARARDLIRQALA